MENTEPQMCSDVPSLDLADSSVGRHDLNAASSTLDPKISHAVLLTVSQFLRRLLRFIFGVAVARSLGARNFGVYAVLYAVTEMIAWASGTGFSEYLARESAVDPTEVWAIAPQIILLRFYYAVPLAALGVAILWLLKYPGSVLTAAVWFCLSLFPRIVGEVIQGVLRGLMRYGRFFSIELGLGLPLLAGGTFLLLRGGGLKVVIATEIISWSAGLGVALIAAVPLWARQGRWDGWWMVVRRTLPFNLYPLASILYDRVDAVMISKLAGDYATGIYGAAYWALGAMQLLPYGILISLLPALSRGTWGASQTQRLGKAMDLLLNVGFLAVLVALAFAGPAVHLLLGPGYSDSAIAIQILIWAVIPRYINFALAIGLLAMRREKGFIVTSSVCLVVNVIGNLILIPRFSWRAAAFVTIITELVLLAQNLWWVHKVTGAIPVPQGAARSLAVFLGLLLLAFVGKSLVTPVVMGSVCISLFLAYVIHSGMIDEFKTAWQASPDLAE